MNECTRERTNEHKAQERDDKQSNITKTILRTKFRHSLLACIKAESIWNVLFPIPLDSLPVL